MSVRRDRPTGRLPSEDHHYLLSFGKYAVSAHTHLVEDPLTIAAGVRSVYQPVVDLRGRNVVGYEALARGPANGPLERPDRLFAAARERGVTAELDWACRAAAFDGALTAGLSAASTLFVNVEPAAMDTTSPAQFAATMARARQGLRVVLEVTERALTAKPAELLRVVEEIRTLGWGIALDDVGADWRSLALMPFIRPDVVKLDRHIVQGPIDANHSLLMDAVRAYAASSGAHILAEGIETEAHLSRARSLGATLGQGWLFGRPEALPDLRAAQPVSESQLVVGQQPLTDRTPAQTIEDLIPMSVASKADLLGMTRAIEHSALNTTEPCVILSAFQTADHFTPATARLYAQLAVRSAFVGAFGEGMAGEPAPGVRGADLPDNHSLRGEWVVILVAPHYARALIARDLGDRGPDLERRFRYAVVTDRDLVLRAGRALMLKMSSLTNISEPQPAKAIVV